jgi:hypothetical protein
MLLVQFTAREARLHKPDASPLWKSNNHAAGAVLRLSSEEIAS